MKLTPDFVKDLEWTNWIIPSRENDSKNKLILKIVSIISTVGLILLFTLTIDVSKSLFEKLFGRTQLIKSPIKDTGTPKLKEKIISKATDKKKDSDKNEKKPTPPEPVPPLIAYLQTKITKENIAKTANFAIKGLKLAPEVLYENLLKEPNWYKKTVLIIGAAFPFWIAAKGNFKWTILTSVTYYGSVIGYNITRAKIEKLASSLKNAIPLEVKETVRKIKNDFTKA